MADETSALPFDPADTPPMIDDDTPQSERVVAAAHAHYLHIRQALDSIDTSAYQARCANVDAKLVETIEIQAYSDHELESSDEELTVEITSYDE